jgi:hypothetical protein
VTGVVLERADDAARPAAREPRALAAWLERHATVPDGTCERFDGYGVMGLPFSSGHILALRRFPASSIGPAYSSVWHRTPSGRWTFYTDNEPGRDCTRYFSASVNETIRTEITLDWKGPCRLEVRVPAAALIWETEVTETWQTRTMNTLGAMLPQPLWHRRPILSAMAFAVQHLLGTGPVRLWGRSSNGHHFIANLRRIWVVSHARAAIAGNDLGTPAPTPEPVRLGDFRIPQRGLLAFGQALFAGDGSLRW